MPRTDSGRRVGSPGIRWPCRRLLRCVPAAVNGAVHGADCGPGPEPRQLSPVQRVSARAGSLTSPAGPRAGSPAWAPLRRSEDCALSRMSWCRSRPSRLVHVSRSGSGLLRVQPQERSLRAGLEQRPGVPATLAGEISQAPSPGPSGPPEQPHTCFCLSLPSLPEWGDKCLGARPPPPPGSCPRPRFGEGLTLLPTPRAGTREPKRKRSTHRAGPRRLDSHLTEPGSIDVLVSGHSAGRPTGGPRTWGGFSPGASVPALGFCHPWDSAARAGLAKDGSLTSLPAARAAGCALPSQG